MEYLKKCSQHEVVKKAFTFEEAEINKFLREGNNHNAWILVRKAIAVVAICGGHRMAELRRLTFDDVSQVSNGFVVQYQHFKKSGLKRIHSSYLIPYRGDKSDEICYGTILRTYIEAVNESLQKKPHKSKPLFFTGKNETKKGCVFLNSPVGINTLADTGKKIASWLGLPNPDGYTGHCFRRTAASLAADNNASCLQMSTHFGWRNPKIALEYISNARPQRNKMTILISGYSSSNAKTDPTQENEQKAVGQEDPLSTDQIDDEEVGLFVENVDDDEYEPSTENVDEDENPLAVEHVSEDKDASSLKRLNDGEDAACKRLCIDNMNGYTLNFNFF
ncbi:uncharacterized protein LOC131883899 [Tigriopus californicus]|uniref:uncharacterized protein LOC131883899 n=1 Tax=Tigriopus californicus TaxID=6832 RepID=UPI0027DA1910|nr:uncharacterized protein LOC131883899 [Tigriopus californicus]